MISFFLSYLIRIVYFEVLFFIFNVKGFCNVRSGGEVVFGFKIYEWFFKI